MQNLIVVAGALVGVVLGGWTSVFLFHDGADAAVGVTVLMGAIPGTLVGGWIAMKLATRDT